MPTVTFVNEKKQVEVQRGEILRYPLLLEDVQPYCGLWKYANCHGNGLCGTDRVLVSPISHVNERTVFENFWLKNEIERHPTIRLSCQVRVYDDITVETLCLVNDEQ